MSKIHRHKTGAMRELQQHASRGYTRWVGGTIAPRKLDALALKFADRYQIDRTAQQRWRAKAKDEASSWLVSWYDDKAELVHWWLLATPGAGLVADLETLHDTGDKKNRITLTGYELLKAPQRGRAASWTWRMTRENEEAWRERLRVAIRRRNDDLTRQSLWSLARVPGFAGIRQQAWDLFQTARADWQRSQRDEWPHGKQFLGWEGQFKTADTLGTRAFGEIVRQGRKPWS